MPNKKRKLKEILISGLEPIQDAVYNLQGKYHHFRDRVERIWSYIPVLWRVYDFDWTSAFHVLEHQLSRLEYAILNGHSATRKKTARDIRIVRDCLKRLSEDHRIRLAEKEWDEWHASFGEGDFLDSINKPRTKEQDRLFRIAQAKEEELIKYFEGMLFSGLKKYRHWWD